LVRFHGCPLADPSGREGVGVEHCSYIKDDIW
jgi:hypothetical protein